MSFRFKRFAINDHRCAQKVGTDGVLLGAWAPLAGSRVLDVGTGSGLIALMIAQRFPLAQIVGIDIDAESVAQAAENAAACEWADRVTMLQADFLTWETPVLFDAIVSNPPFFERALECPDCRRAAARHTSALPLRQLALRSGMLLREGGSLSVVLPYDAATDFVFACQTAGLNLACRCNIHTVERKPFRRSLLHFVKGCSFTYKEETLTLLTPLGTRTAEHDALTREFYL